MGPRRRRRCLHCGELFEPDCRNRRHQRYCQKPLPVPRKQAGWSALLTDKRQKRALSLKAPAPLTRHVTSRANPQESSNFQNG